MTLATSLARRLLAGAFTLTVVGALIGCSTDAGQRPQATARGPAWTIDNAASELRFVTTKNTNVSENQKFTRLAGSIAPGGAVSLVIDLSSVETQIPIRNERLQTMLFEVTRYPTANFETSVDPAKVAGLKVGDSGDLDVPGRLSIHGKTQDVTAALRVVRLKNDRLLVSTRAPVLVNAAHYELSEGIEQLRAVMGLPNIVGTVPVTFSIVFQPQA